MIFDTCHSFPTPLQMEQSPPPPSSNPPLGCFKINMDRASAEDGKGSSIGMIIRDSYGIAIGAFKKLLPSTFIAEVTEAIAIHQGVLFAFEMNIPWAIFESDALSIILALNLGDEGREIGHILEDISLAKLTFSWCTF